MAHVELLPETTSYYISSLRRRRTLIPMPDIQAYRCITEAAEGPVDGVDKIVVNQVAFDDMLIKLNVYPKRNPLDRLFANIWSDWHIDKVVPMAKPGEPKETLLYLLDSPHRPAHPTQG